MGRTVGLCLNERVECLPPTRWYFNDSGLFIGTIILVITSGIVSHYRLITIFIMTAMSITIINMKGNDNYLLFAIIIITTLY